MTYIQPHMTKSLKNHVLEKHGDNHYVMRRRGTGMFLLHVAVVGNRIVLTGDLQIGPLHGCVSAGGYGIGWFASIKSEDYLCEKFLPVVWEWERAVEEIEDRIKNPEDYGLEDDEIAKFKSLIGDDWIWPFSTPNEVHFCDAMYEMDFDMSDGAPGYGYALADAGWLAAVNVKFSELFAARTYGEEQ